MNKEIELKRTLQLIPLSFLIMGLILSKGQFRFEFEYIFGFIITLIGLFWWIYQDKIFDNAKKDEFKRLSKQSSNKKELGVEEKDES